MFSMKKVRCSKTEEKRFVVTGESPVRFAVDEQTYVAEDNYNVCLRSIYNNLTIYPKSRVFKTREEAHYFMLIGMQKIIDGNLLKDVKEEVAKARKA